MTVYTTGILATRVNFNDIIFGHCWNLTTATVISQRSSQHNPVCECPIEELLTFLQTLAPTFLKNKSILYKWRCMDQREITPSQDAVTLPRVIIRIQNLVWLKFVTNNSMLPTYFHTLWYFPLIIPKKRLYCHLQSYSMASNAPTKSTHTEECGKGKVKGNAVLALN